MSEGRHISPAGYFLVFGALLVLTVTTVVVAEAELEHLHTPVALAIAGLKAALVVLIFMHALHSTRLTWVVIIGAVFWLVIMFALTLSDYLTRGWLVY
jgi:cytochrome c oxidase subunit 4